MADTVAILEAARARITDTRRYFIAARQGGRAWNDDGRDCPPADPAAVRWSASGAVMAEAGGDAAVALRLLDRAAQAQYDAEPRRPLCQQQLCCQDHGAALAVYDEAIRLAEAAGRSA